MPAIEARAAVTAALGFAARGWPVFPLAGKRPITARGLHDATTDPALIGRWFARDANIGLRTGNGLLVLDIDGAEGENSLYELEQTYGALPKTASAKTGGGGMHFYLTTAMSTRNTAGKIGRGVDTRGDGGYVVAPPSVHPDTGRSYCWDNAPDDVVVARAPGWLLDQLQEPPAGARKRTPASEWTRMLAGIPAGERNHALTRLAGHLLAHRLDPRVALELLHAVNAARCKPPLAADEVTRIAESIAGREIRKRAA